MSSNRKICDVTSMEDVITGYEVILDDNIPQSYLVLKCALYAVVLALPTLTGGHSQQMAPTSMGHFSVAFSQPLDVMYLCFKHSLAKSKCTSCPYLWEAVRWLCPPVNVGRALV